MERPRLGFPFARSAAAQVNYSCVQIGHAILRRHRITGAVQRGNSVTHSVADATRNWRFDSGDPSARRRQWSGSQTKLLDGIPSNVAKNRMAPAIIGARAMSGTEKAPAVDGPGQVSRAERNVEFSPSRSATSVGRLRAEHPLVALPTFWVLFIQKFARRSQGTNTFDLNQNFEPRARNRRPTAGAAL